MNEETKIGLTSADDLEIYPSTILEFIFRAKENINWIKTTKIKNSLKIKEITYLCDSLYEKPFADYVLLRLARYR